MSFCVTSVNTAHHDVGSIEDVQRFAVRAGMFLDGPISNRERPVESALPIGMTASRALVAIGGASSAARAVPSEQAGSAVAHKAAASISVWRRKRV
jgi:hypothetical protein